MSATSIIAYLSDREQRWLHGGLVASVVLLVAVELLRRVDPLFVGAASIGDVVVALCASYAIGWTIFYLSSWRQRAADRFHAAPAILRSLIPLSNVPQAFIKNVVDSEPDHMTTQEFLDVLLSIDLVAEARVVSGVGGRRLTVLEALQDSLEHATGLLADLDRWALVIDPELLYLAARVGNDSYLTNLGRHLGASKYTSLGAIGSGLAAWCAAADDLKVLACERHADDFPRVNDDWDVVNLCATVFLVNPE